MLADTEQKAATPAGGRHFVRRGPTRRWMAVFLSLLTLSVVAAAALTYVGLDTVRSSRAGNVVSTVTDPEAPGFEALLEPTPTLAVLHVDGGLVRSISVLALNSGDQGGSVLLVPPRVYGNEGDYVDLASVVELGDDVEAVIPSLQRAVRFGIAEVAVIDDARWADLVAPVEPLTIDNPVAAEGFPAGQITLSADQVGPFLSATAPGEAPGSLVSRQRALFRAWLGAIADSTDPVSVTGEVETGLGRFVRGLGRGPVQIETAPITEITVDGVPRPLVDAAAMDALVPQLVAFPVAERPGGRVRVRLLDGTGDPQHVQRAAPLVIPADAEIVVVGNADAFDYEATEIRYHTPAAKAAATKLQRALGTGTVIDVPRQTDAFDVTIVLGPDL